MTVSQVALKNATIAARVAMSEGAPSKHLIALMEAGLVESDWMNLASYAVPESLQYLHDGTSTNYDSVGVLQQRAGWGSVEQRMDVTYSVKAFLTAAAEKDKPSFSAGQLAQAIQVSAYPDRYTERYQEALDLLDAIRKGEDMPILQLVKTKNDSSVYLSENYMTRRLISNTADLLVIQELLRSKGIDSSIKVVGSLSPYGVVL